MKLSAARLLADLSAPGRMLAFCDETDITLQPTSTMVPNVHMVAGLLVRSADYEKLASKLENYRMAHGLPEFHANEIVTPGSKSKWRPIALSRRIEAFQLACGLVT